MWNFLRVAANSPLTTGENWLQRSLFVNFIDYKKAMQCAISLLARERRKKLSLSLFLSFYRVQIQFNRNKRWSENVEIAPAPKTR